MNNMMPQGPAVAIDLGTTNCCVAVFRRGKVEIIPNELGDCTTPSYVAFTDTRRLIGLAAKEQMDLNPSRTIFDVKSLLGRKFKDACVQDNIKNWPFEVVSINDKPHIVINTNNERNTYSAEHICSMLFVKMKATAEAYLNQRVNNVVITVPAYFNEAQRQATRDAAGIAGLYVLRVMNEQSAASFAFGFNKTFDRMRYVLIFDMGATHLTVSIVSIEGDLYEVKWSASNTQLGGQSFDDRLVNHFVQTFKRKHKKDLTLDKRAMYRLRTACEDAKKSLSTLTEVNIQINSLIDDINLETSVMRIRFEELSADLFSKAMQTVQTALSDAKLKTSNINDIVLVGGSTRIPKLQYMLRALFKRKDLPRSVNPDEAVAYGATLQAALMLGGEAALMMHDVTPYSLGIGTEGGTMTVLIKRNTVLPCEGSEMFTVPANETSMLIRVFEGESSMIKDNNLLIVIDFKGITPAPCGVTQVAVSFEAFLDGILHVTVMDCSTDSKNSITKHKGRLSKADIERMFIDAETYRYEAARQRGTEAAKNCLKSYCFKIKANLKNNNYVKLKSSLSYSDRNNLMRKCYETLKWFNANQEAEKEDYEKRLKNLQRGCNAIIVNSDDRKIFEHNPIQLVDNIKKNQRKLIMKIMF